MCNNSLILANVVFCCFLVSCSNNTPTLAPQTSGEFNLLTYNVAGLPSGISPSSPEVNTPLISPLLNQYDIVLVQEDFEFHDELKSQAQHSFQSEPHNVSGQFNFGDGLNRFSNFPFTFFQRVAWLNCSNLNGNDCLARKGFSFAETKITEKAIIDIYNAHFDAGNSQSDFDARLAQIDQLVEAINSQSIGKAVIVAGDTNLDTEGRGQDAQLLQRLLANTGLIDACRSLSCDNEQVDRVLFRQSTAVRLEAVSWEIDGAFVDAQGQKLSDHNAIGVTFSWEVK